MGFDFGNIEVEQQNIAGDLHDVFKETIEEKFENLGYRHLFDFISKIMGGADALIKFNQPINFNYDEQLIRLQTCYNLTNRTQQGLSLLYYSLEQLMTKDINLVRQFASEGIILDSDMFRNHQHMIDVSIMGDIIHELTIQTRYTIYGVSPAMVLQQLQNLRKYCMSSGRDAVIPHIWSPSGCYGQTRTYLKRLWNIIKYAKEHPKWTDLLDDVFISIHPFNDLVREFAHECDKQRNDSKITEVYSLYDFKGSGYTPLSRVYTVLYELVRIHKIL